jgi:dihydrofolate reductase
MAKLLYSATMSLDGFIAGAGGDMSWLADHVVGDSATVQRLLANVGALLVGHNTFGGDDPNRGTDEEGAFGGEYHGPVVVLTHRPPADPPAGVTFRGDLHSAVAEAKEAAGDKYVNVLGANVAKQMPRGGTARRGARVRRAGAARRRRAAVPQPRRHQRAADPVAR